MERRSRAVLGGPETLPVLDRVLEREDPPAGLRRPVQARLVVGRRVARLVLGHDVEVVGRAGRQLPHRRAVRGGVDRRPVDDGRRRGGGAPDEAGRRRLVGGPAHRDVDVGRGHDDVGDRGRPAVHRRRRVHCPRGGGGVGVADRDRRAVGHRDFAVLRARGRDRRQLRDEHAGLRPRLRQRQRERRRVHGGEDLDLLGPRADQVGVLERHGELVRAVDDAAVDRQRSGARNRLDRRAVADRPFAGVDRADRLHAVEVLHRVQRAGVRVSGGRAVEHVGDLGEAHRAAVFVAQDAVLRRAGNRRPVQRRLSVAGERGQRRLAGRDARGVALVRRVGRRAAGDAVTREGRVDRGGVRRAVGQVAVVVVRGAQHAVHAPRAAAVGLVPVRVVAGVVRRRRRARGVPEPVHELPGAGHVECALGGQVAVREVPHRLAADVRLAVPFVAARAGIGRVLVAAEAARPAQHRRRHRNARLAVGEVDVPHAGAGLAVVAVAVAAVPLEEAGAEAGLVGLQRGGEVAVRLPGPLVGTEVVAVVRVEAVGELVQRDAGKLPGVAADAAGAEEVEAPGRRIPVRVAGVENVDVGENRLREPRVRRQVGQRLLLDLVDVVELRARGAGVAGAADAGRRAVARRARAEVEVSRGRGERDRAAFVDDLHPLADERGRRRVAREAPAGVGVDVAAGAVGTHVGEREGPVLLLARLVERQGVAVRAAVDVRVEEPHDLAGLGVDPSFPRSGAPAPDERRDVDEPIGDRVAGRFGRDQQTRRGGDPVLRPPAADVVPESVPRVLDGERGGRVERGDRLRRHELLPHLDEGAVVDAEDDVRVLDVDSPVRPLEVDEVGVVPERPARAVHQPQVARIDAEEIRVRLEERDRPFGHRRLGHVLRRRARRERAGRPGRRIHRAGEPRLASLEHRGPPGGGVEGHPPGPRGARRRQRAERGDRAGPLQGGRLLGGQVPRRNDGRRLGGLQPVEVAAAAAGDLRRRREERGGNEKRNEREAGPADPLTQRHERGSLRGWTANVSSPRAMERPVPAAGRVRFSHRASAFQTFLLCFIRTDSRRERWTFGH